MKQNMEVDIMDCIFNVKLIRPMDVSDFVAAASSCPKEIEIIASHGKYDVYARSIMGMFGLNLSEPITITMSGETNILNTYSKVFDKWSVKE